MDSAIVVALISVGVSLATAWWTARENQRSRRSLTDLEKFKFDLERAAKREDQRADVATHVARYTEPLRRESQDLHHRLRNITSNNFLAYLHSPRHDAAINTTLFRLAKFFAVKELFDKNVTVEDLKSAGVPKQVADLLANVGSAFATDDYDRSGGLETSRFMIWREEQRAMADIATCPDEVGRPGVVGYTTFVDRLGTGSSTWFGTFVNDVESADMSASERVRKVEHLLKQLVEQLTTTRMPTGRTTEQDERSHGNQDDQTAENSDPPDPPR